MPDADGCTISINLCILIGNTENLPLAASLAYFGIKRLFRRNAGTAESSKFSRSERNGRKTHKKRCRKN